MEPDHFCGIQAQFEHHFERFEPTEFHELHRLFDIHVSRQRPGVTSDRIDDKFAFRVLCRRELESLIYLAALSMDLWPPASAYGGPVKLIGADPDDKDGPPIGAANRALASEGGYDYDAIGQTGHLLQIERPDACREAKLSFLRKHDLA